MSHIPALCSTGILPKETPPQRSEPRADLFRKELRLFPGSKVAAFLNLVVMDKFGIRPLCPTPRGLIELFR